VAIQEQLLAALDGHRGAEAADRLCEACVVLLNIDAAATVVLNNQHQVGRRRLSAVCTNAATPTQVFLALWMPNFAYHKFGPHHRC
jgi:hypothetical protein